MFLLLHEQIPDLIADLKAVGVVNITYGDGQGMLCGKALSPNDKMLEIDIGTDDEAWAINRAKAVVDQGDDAKTHELLATLCGTRH